MPAQGEITVRRAVIAAKKRCVNVSRMMTLEIAYWPQNQHSYTGAVFITGKLYRIKLGASLVERVTDYAGKSVFESDKKQAE